MLQETDIPLAWAWQQNSRAETESKEVRKMRWKAEGGFFLAIKTP